MSSYERHYRDIYLDRLVPFSPPPHPLSLTLALALALALFLSLTLTLRSSVSCYFVLFVGRSLIGRGAR